MKKLAIVTTHPIQYNAPVFRLLTEREKILVKVFYTWEKGAEGFDEGFGKSISWDIPLLAGYEYSFVGNSGNHGKGFWDVRNPGLIDEIRKWHPDAVLVYGWNFYSHLQVMRYFKGRKPVWFRGDSTLMAQSKRIRKMMRGISLRWVYSHVDFALAVGKQNRRYFLKHGLKKDQIHFVPHAIDNERFAGETEEQIRYRQQLIDTLGLQKDSQNFVFAGKFQDQKNLPLLLSAFISLKRDNWNLILVGNGELEEELKSIASQHNNIHFLPFQNQSMIPAIYRLGEVFVLSSKDETWGLAVNEAMACGRAVVVSDRVGCAIDLVQNGVNGFVFKSGDITDLIQKLELAKKSNLEAMGSRSKEIIHAWSFDVQANTIETLLKRTQMSASKTNTWR